MLPDAKETSSAGTRMRALLTVAALAAVGAGTVHLAATPVHLRESALLGGFFLALSALQFGYAVAVRYRPGQVLLCLGVLGNAGVVGLWVYTRTVGIPFGISNGEIEAIAYPDLLATVFGLVTSVAGGLAIVQLRRGARPRAGRLSLGLAAGALAVVAGTDVVIRATGIN